MPSQPNDGRKRPNARARAAALREEQRKKEARRRWLTIGGIVGLVVIVVAVIVVVGVTKKDKKSSGSRSAAPAAVVTQVTTVPAADFAKVGTESVQGGPKKVSGKALTFDGKPGVLYYGAEYCPYCAEERWPFVVALSRFGTWSSLSQTTSSASDVHPNTATFSFHGASYTSPYISLSHVETLTNDQKPLETPTAEQAAIIKQYGTGSIPFIDFGNKFVIEGGTYDSTVLDGKSFDEIGAAVADPSSAIGKAVLGNANVMTAAICEMTGGKPGNVCDASNIKTLRTTLNAQK